MLPRHVSQPHPNNWWHEQGYDSANPDGSRALPGTNTHTHINTHKHTHTLVRGPSPRLSFTVRREYLSCPLVPSCTQGIMKQLFERCPQALSSEVDRGNWFKYVQLPVHVVSIHPFRLPLPSHSGTAWVWSQRICPYLFSFPKLTFKNEFPPSDISI